MIIDHRTYNIKHGKSQIYIALFKDCGLPIQLKHLGNLIGYFETVIGTLNQVIHLWGYIDFADMEKRRHARDTDPAWAIYKKKSAGMLISQENKIIKPVNFSPSR
ncbi:MAG: hypothetical protein CBB68_12695 [Rhodospirillaceae bacterium TMED8]|nr:NIPSNAP family protein [Magnetovibrio sp.]OUT48967.1 MAG: hypothetical protein CBB68_12695 [Rhodospirillaceae bacterium TMED8]